MTEQEKWLEEMRGKTASQILDDLEAEYADDDLALSMIANRRRDIEKVPEERGWRLALGLAGDLELYA